MWTIEEIQADWLAGSSLAVDPEDIVGAFDRSERLLGRQWINAQHFVPGGGVLTGSSPTLRVVTVGLQLASIEGVQGAEELLNKIRSGDYSAEAELTAIDLLRARHPFEVDLYPTITNHSRVPDFRVRESGGPWVYVEVHLTTASEAYRRGMTMMQRLTGVARDVKSRFTLEVYLR